MPVIADTRLRPLEALRALRALLDDPEDTAKAFAVVRALDRGHVSRLFHRFAGDHGGRALLEMRPSLLASLTNRDALQRMPPGSLGRSYLDFCDREGIVLGGLVELSEDPERDRLPPDLRFMADRLRDSHDLWHVVTGCRTDLPGELAILAFTAAQTGALGVGTIVAAGYLRSFTQPMVNAEGRALVRSAWRLGRTAAWLPGVRWEDHLTRPLEEVRRELRIRPLHNVSESPILHRAA